jgi:hypothetical protein
VGSDIIKFQSGTISGVVFQVEERNHFSVIHAHHRGIMIRDNVNARLARSVSFTIRVENMSEVLGAVEDAGGYTWQ